MDVIIKETGVTKTLVIIDPCTKKPYPSHSLESWLGIRNKHDPAHITWIVSTRHYQEWQDLIIKKQNSFISEYLKTNYIKANVTPLN